MAVERAEVLAAPFLGGALAQPAPQIEDENGRDSEYAELKRLVKNAGLLEKRPGYYVLKMLLNMGMLALSITVLAFVENVWLQLLNAVFLALAIVQTGFVGHDVGHQQVFRSSRYNEILGLTIGFLFGMSRSWWVEKHNEHHSNPNQIDMDPDIDIPIIAFSEEQAREVTGLYRLVVKYQAFLFYPVVAFEGIGLRMASIVHIINNKVKYPVAEPLIMVGHIGVYLGLVFYFLSFWHAVLFIVVNQAVIGLYTGSTFAPNHKGMLILGKDSQMDFLRRQVLTSRNVKSGLINDFLYGGLNYQIEHHLFPSMPRNRLKDAQQIVRPFCQAHDISYHETGPLQSQREILQHLHQVSAPLRAKS